MADQDPNKHHDDDGVSEVEPFRPPPKWLFIAFSAAWTVWVLFLMLMAWIRWS